METQHRFVSKKEAYKIIDNAPGIRVMIFTYNKKTGMSDNGRYVKKNKGKKLVDKAKVLVLTENSLIMTLNLYGRIFYDFSCYDKENIYKSIMLAKNRIN